MDLDAAMKQVADRYKQQEGSEQQTEEKTGEEQQSQSQEQTQETESQTQESSHAQEQQTQKTQQAHESESSQRSPEITADKVLEYMEQNEDVLYKVLSKKAGKEVKSLDDLKIVQEKEPELPEDVRAFYEWKKETGRDLNDYLKVQKDWNSESKDSVVMEYIRQRDGLDGQELKDYYSLYFEPDEDADDRERKKIELEREKAYRQGLQYLNKQKEQFQIPTDSKEAQRQAELQKQKENEQFRKNMRQAVESLNSVKIDGFEYKVGDEFKQKKKLDSLDDVLNNFKQGDQFSYQDLAKAIYLKDNFHNIAKAYAEQYKNQVIEEELKKRSNNKGVPTSTPSPGGGSMSAKDVLDKFNKMAGR